MTVISTHQDIDACTLTLVADFTAPPEQVWELWADARKLEQWWMPPGYPATFTRHDFTVGGRSEYYSTGPDGHRTHGYWEMTALTPPRALTFTDGFADAAGNPASNPAPTTNTVTFEATDTGTRMTLVGQFTDREHLEQLVGMGMEEGLRLSVGQMDALLVPSPR